MNLKTEPIKDLMHPQILEKTGGAIDHVPTRPIDIKMGLQDKRSFLEGRNGGIKLEVDIRNGVHIDSLLNDL